jgi:hypothetical protein
LSINSQFVSTTIVTFCSDVLLRIKECRDDVVGDVAGDVAADVVGDVER